MTHYEYKVIPAPTRGRKAKGVKTAEGRFALGVETVLNELARDGWEYQRAELLPSEERSGLTGTAIKWRNVLVFRRAVPDRIADRPAEAEGSTPATPPPVAPDAPAAPMPDSADDDAATGKAP